MKPAFIILMLLFMASISMTVRANPHPPKKEKPEKQVLASVNALWEVKAFMHDHRAAKPMLMIARDPGPNFKYYWVKMGIGDDGMFRTTENFCVDPKTLKVYYWDETADDFSFSNSAIIPIANWRRWRKTAAWQKPHTYKAGKLVALAH